MHSMQVCPRPCKSMFGLAESVVTLCSGLEGPGLMFITHGTCKSTRTNSGSELQPCNLNYMYCTDFGDSISDNISLHSCDEKRHCSSSGVKKSSAPASKQAPKNTHQQSPPRLSSPSVEEESPEDELG